MGHNSNNNNKSMAHTVFDKDRVAKAQIAQIKE